MDARIVALAKVVKEKTLSTAREGLTVGTHSVDCLVHITGSIKVGEDTEMEVRSPAVNYKAAFATVCGMLVEQCRLRGEPLSNELLQDVIALAMRQDEIAANIGGVMSDWVEAAERDCTKVTGTKTKNGSVTTKLEYEFKGLSQAVAA